MATFTFHIDQKETIWIRNFSQIEADTEEEAILKMRALANSVDYDLGVYENVLILETSEDINYYDNLSNPTREIYYKDEMIEDNTPLCQERK